MVSRRSFLKKLGAVCGTAVIAPTALLKTRPTRPTRPTGLYIDTDAPAQWRSYYMEYKYDPEMPKKFRVAFKNTKFISPLRTFKCKGLSIA